jgi:1,4-alpha-glucan branching enzyme
MPHTLHHDISRFGQSDIYYFKEGTHAHLYNHFGAHPMQREEKAGFYFAVWAPNASYVSVRGDFNHYDAQSHPLQLREDGSGIWEGFIEGVSRGDTYKYHIRSHHHGMVQDKSDPFAFFAEVAPHSASRAWGIGAHE